jgi:hypothetical protein
MERHTINGKKCIMINIDKKKSKKNDSYVDEVPNVDNEIDEKKEIISKKNQLTRLTDQNKKPTKPEHFLDADELKEKLRLCTRVNTNDVHELAIGTRIVYVEVSDDGFKYRTGGSIIVNEAKNGYLVLASNRKSWSVQLDRCIIFKLKFDSTVQEYKDKIDELENKIKNYADVNIKLYEMNKKLRDDNKNLRNSNIITNKKKK